ncbi:MAG: A/G-specific adenine glycosylase [Cytophagaceae bacterium]|nr:A/G-specific adenine glycosylase [Cytophagaceae bacterium]MDW8456225.1 A/G-specific adenine glycosylase [Cytophagaceae bacterium]
MENTDFFSRELIEWYKTNKRDLPWRETKDPYLIWLSEVILQQTRVVQGMPYYFKFVEKYNNIHALARASETEILRDWQGLGYYSRAKNLHHTARFISTQLNGKFPESYAALTQLKGIGPYTAAAIASFAFDEDVAAVDGNVERVLCRVFGITENTKLPQVKRTINELALQLLPKGNSAIYNQAVMEYGALICTPKKPNCQACSIRLYCFAYQQNLQTMLPNKHKSKPKKLRYINYLVICSNKKIFMQQRKQQDIWRGLYEFLPIETHPDDFLNNELIFKTAFADNAQKIKLLYETSILTHTLSHQLLHCRFLVVTSDDFKKNLSAKNGFFTIEEIKNLPKPVLINNFLEHHIF